MMRSSVLEACLAGPHLRYDETAVNLVAKDLEGAQKYLASVKGKKDAIDQIVTSYQAMYQATLALLHSINYKATGFRPIVTALEDTFVKKGILDRVHLEHLLRGQKVLGTPQENLEAAEAYLAAVKKALGK